VLGFLQKIRYSPYMELDVVASEKVAAYKPDKAKLDVIRDVPLMFMVGITSAGKNAVLHRLLEKYPDNYYFIVSHTTRAPRENHGVMEQDGKEYHFIDLQAMKSLLDNHDLIEAQVIHSAWISGTSIAEVQKAQANGKIPVSDIDIQGAEAYVGFGLNAKPIFILPPSYDVWMERLMTRYEGKPHKHDLFLRMQAAVGEIERAMTLDDFYIVINDNLDHTVDLAHKIAQGEPVEPHYHKAMDIAEQLLVRIRAELEKM